MPVKQRRSCRRHGDHVGKKRYEFPVKLTATEVAMIRGIVRLDRHERRKAGFARGTNGLAKRLAVAYGVSEWCIESIIKGKRWKTVEAKTSQYLMGS